MSSNLTDSYVKKCRAEDFHPWECDGPGQCRHCDRRLEEHHDPETCALCDEPALTSRLEDWEMSR
jgi:hypothetical protein